MSHGVSFFQNFIGEREYAGASTTALMAVPYRRIIVMHLTIIFGRWIVLALGTPAPALLVLVVMKMLVNLRAHRREHAARRALRLRNLQLPLGWTRTTTRRDSSPIDRAHSRAGLSGMSRCAMPSGRSASTVAFTSAGSDPVHPASPTPFAPSAFVGVGTGCSCTPMSPIIPARGMK